MDIEGLRTDERLEEDGVWTEVALFGAMLELKLARIGNRAYQKSKEAREKPYQRQLRDGSVSTEVQEKILIQCMARHVVKDWRDLERGGEPFPYSVENAEWLLTANRDLLDAVVRAATDAEHYRQQSIEDDAGN